MFFIHAFAAAAVLCLPYVPDLYASFVKAGEQNPISLALAFFALGIFTYGCLRLPLTLLLGRWIFLRRFRSSYRITALYILFLSGEFVFFHSWNPITYFPALPAPLPQSTFHLDAPATHSSEPRSVLLVESFFNKSSREEIQKGGSLALSLLAEKLGRHFSEQLTSDRLAAEITVILPETFVSLESSEDAFVLSQAVYAKLRLSHGVQRMAWIQGAFWQNTNVVLGWEIKGENESFQLESVRQKIRLLRVKSEHVPLFEIASKGISYSQVQNDKTLREEEPLSDQPMLSEFLSRHRILVCYESLYPHNWNFQKETVIMTNHHLFTEYKLMNWVYLGFIRQLSFIYRSPAYVVSNYNSSGRLDPWLGLFPNEKKSFRASWEVVKID
ncbi:MAG: hypothetical protein FJY29_12405 [Betaproteobacteria bacterium]|nr:hypothetical protein [Betaproteobacteria bacterium]